MYLTRLVRTGNSTGLTLSREVLAAARLDRGDAVSVNVRDGKIEVAKADDAYNKAMEVGRAFSARYRRAMSALAK